MPTRNSYLIEKTNARNMRMNLKKNRGLINQKINRKAFHPASVMRGGAGESDDDWVMVKKPEPEKFQWVESDQEFLERIEKLVKEREKENSQSESKHRGKKTKIIEDNSDDEIKYEMKEVDGKGRL